MSTRFYRWVILIVILLLSTCSGSVDAQASSSASTDHEEDIQKLLDISYYDLLGISPSATADVIKRAYRAAALKYHPDKFQDDNEKTYAHEVFLRVVMANEVLNNESKRNDYNWLLENGIFNYDERKLRELRIEEDAKKYGKYHAYAYAAMRGDVDETVILTLVAVVTSICLISPSLIAYVRKYYREHQARLDRLVQVEKNKKEMEKRRFQEQERLEALKIEQERIAAQRLKASMEESDSDDERKPMTEEELINRNLRLKEKMERRHQSKRARQELKSLLLIHSHPKDSEFQSLFDSSEIENLCSKLDSSSIAEVISSLTPLLPLTPVSLGSTSSKMAKQLEKAKSIFHDIYSVNFPASGKSNIVRLKTQGPGDLSSQQTKSVAWTDIELSALAKGTSKYPGGTPNRWEKITHMINAAGNGNRSEKEVLARVRLDEFRSITDKAISSNQGTDGSTKADVAIDESNETPNSLDKWSAYEQLAFESALRTTANVADKSLRWEKIAELVGKNKAQCIRRYKEIQAQIKASQK